MTPSSRPGRRSRGGDGSGGDARAAAQAEHPPEQEEEAEQDTDIIIESVNGSAWSTCLAYARLSQAWVICCQEVKITSDEEQAEASQQARQSGYKSLWSQGWRQEQDGKSAGVCLLVREDIGLRPPASGAQLYRGRAVAGIVDFAGLSWLIISTYLEVSGGMGPTNSAVMAAIGAAVVEEGLPWFAGGDFNQSPQAITASGFATRAAAVVWPPKRPTCITTRSSSTIDMFILDRTVAKAVSEVRVVADTRVAISPHRPIRLTIKKKVKALTVQVLEQPERIPSQLPFGPEAEPKTSWAGPLAALESLNEKRDELPLDQLDAALEYCYASFASAMEEDIARKTDTVLRRKGRRAHLPRLLTRPAVQAARVHRSAGWVSLARPLRWLQNRSNELGNIIAKAGSNTDGQQLMEDLAFLADELDSEAPEQLSLHEGAAEMATELRRLLSAVAQDAGTACGGEAALELAASMQAELHLRIKEAAASEEANNEKSGKAKWTSWAKEASKASAAVAHRYSRLPKEWRPTEVKVGTAVSANSCDLLKVESSRLQGLWGCQPSPPAFDPVVLPPLPRAPPRVIRKAAATFAGGSAVASDGWHLRHYSWLDDRALTCIAIFFEIAESRGIFPRQQRLIQIFLVEKPKSGLRSLGLFGSLYRLWARVRRALAKCWELQNCRAYCIFGPGGSAVEAVWRQCLRAEEAQAKGHHSASLAWDLREYYEHVDRGDLNRRAAETGFPPQLVRTSTQMYAASRVVTLAGAACKVGFAIKGVVAGCGLATTHIQYYSLPPLDGFTERNPRSLLQVFIDDYLLQCIHASARVVHETLLAAAKDLVNVIEEELGCTVHTGKAATIASSPALLAKLRRSLGALAGPACNQATNLGITVASGRSRGSFWKGSVQRARHQAGKRRAARTLRLRKAIGTKTASILRTGTSPAMTYGAQVYGLSGGEDRTSRIIMASAFFPLSGGVSLDAATALLDDTSWRGTAAPIVQWAAEVWRAVCSAGAAQQRGLALPELRRAWECSRPTLPRRWTEVRGPLGACHLCIQRLGWSWPAPFVFLDNKSSVITLTQVSPKRVAELAREAYRDRHEAQAARRAGAFPSDTLCRARRLLRSGRLTEAEKACMVAAVTHRVWTQDRLLKIGKAVSSQCPLCQGCEDSLAHRAFTCTATADIRDTVLSAVARRFLEQQGDTPEAAAMLRGFFPYHLVAKKSICDDNVFYFWSRSGREKPGLLDFRGHIYTDGSCLKGITKQGDRAGWSVVELDNEGNLVSALAGPVPYLLGQTSQAAEHCALASAVQVITAPSTIATDFLGLVEVLAKPPAVILSARRAHGGPLREVIGHPNWRKVTEIRWCKAHRSLSDHQPGSADFLDVVGNDLADSWAKKGAGAHGEAEDLALAVHWATVTDEVLILVAKAGLRALSLLPLAPRSRRRKAPRPRRQAEETSEQHRAPHYWFFAKAGTWRCAFCHRLVASAGARRRLDRQGCTRTVGVFDSILADPKGHRLAAYETFGSDVDTGSLLACTSCGAWVSCSPQMLRSPCLSAPSAAGKKALRALAKGEHPNHHLADAHVGSALLLPV